MFQGENSSDFLELDRFIVATDHTNIRKESSYKA